MDEKYDRSLSKLAGAPDEIDMVSARALLDKAKYGYDRKCVQ